MSLQLIDSLNEGDMRRCLDRVPLYQDAAELVRTMIQDGRLPPGQKVNEKALCRIFGISRTPLREALKVLARDGLVELRANRGAWVVPLERSDLRALFEALTSVAASVGRLAARQLVQDGGRRAPALLACFDEEAEAGVAAAPDAFRRLYDSHGALAALTGNRFLVVRGQKS